MLDQADNEYIKEEDETMTIKTKFNKGDAVKCWDKSLGWRYGNIQKIKITINSAVLHIQYVVDFSNEFNPKI